MKHVLCGLATWLLSVQLAFAALVVNHTGTTSVDASTGDVIVIFVATGSFSPGAGNITALDVDGTLSFTKRTAITPYTSGLTRTLEEWYAVAASPISSGTINITFVGSPTVQSTTYIAISGANTSTPFDVNGSLPALGSNMTAGVAPSLSVSTTNANTVILGALGAPDNPPAPGTGYTAIGNGAALDSEYKIVSATQSSLAVNWGAADTNAGVAMGMIADAIQQAGAGAAVPNKSLMTLGVGQ